MARPKRNAKSLYKKKQEEAQQPKKGEQKQQKPQDQQLVKKEKDKQQKGQEAEKAESQNKTKKIVKEKKYKKKSSQEKARINRSKVERIFLLRANRYEGNWNFQVQGKTGNYYFVNVSTVVSCTCMDYCFKKIPCKHIYFIVTQVGQNDQLLNYFKKDRRISVTAYKMLDEQLTSRLKSRLEKPSKDSKDIDLKDDTDCVICFTQMDKETEPLDDCSTCKKYFHSQCITAWKSHNPSCPLCRGSLIASISIMPGEGRNDPLGKLVGISL